MNTQTIQPVPNQITDPLFFESGSAIFTVSNPKGDHYTFKITRKETGPWFVNLLTGSDNTSSRNYTYVGCYVPAQLRMVITKNSKYNEESLPFQVFNWAIGAVANLHNNGVPIPEGYKIQHVGRCCACSRRLTTPESITRGIGPVCLEERNKAFG